MPPNYARVSIKWQFTVRMLFLTFNQLIALVVTFWRNNQDTCGKRKNVFWGFYIVRTSYLPFRFFFLVKVVVTLTQYFLIEHDILENVPDQRVRISSSARGSGRRASWTARPDAPPRTPRCPYSGSPAPSGSENSTIPRRTTTLTKSINRKSLCLVLTWFKM